MKCNLCKIEYKTRSNTQKYCSRKCADSAKSLSATMLVKCDFCGSEFERKSYRKKYKHSFCSRNCSSMYLLKHIYTCEICSKKFHRSVSKTQTPRFCSNKCRGVWLKKEIYPDNCTCKSCGKFFRLAPKHIERGNGIYCSVECHHKGLEFNFDTGKEPAKYYRLAKWQRARKLALERDNYICLRCHKKPPEVKLAVNHIIFRQIGGTDDLDNLETLCDSCHAIADRERMIEKYGDYLTAVSILGKTKKPN